MHLHVHVHRTILTSWLRASNLSIVNSMSTMTQIDNVNGVRFVTSNHMSPEGPIFFFLEEW